MHEDGLVQKKVQQMDCLPRSGWLTNLPKGMVAKEKRNLLGIKKSNKKKKLKQLASYCAKFQKMVFLEMVLKVFATSTCSTTQLGWMFRKIQMLWTTTSHLLLNATLNWWSNKWTKKMCHEIAKIKLCSAIGITLHPPQLSECLQKAWPKPKV